MTARRGATRREALAGAAGTAFLLAWPGPARATAPRAHGFTVIGDLKYPAGFTHFAYVNPDAPKGGRIVTQMPARAYNQNFNTFNTLHIYVLRGDGAAGMQYTFASLMAVSSDEPGSCYGYVASEVEISEDGRTYRFFLRPEAAFHDGSPITAEDVVFSILKLREEGHPLLASDLRQVEAALAEDASTVNVTFAANAGRSLPLTVATLPIFSAAWWKDRNFQASYSEAPLGSGPYKLKAYVFGSYVEFERVEGHWADDLPVMRGRYNFARLRYEYYRDRVAAFEAFKKGAMTFREEFTSRIWARDYDFPALSEGRVVKEEVPDGSPSGAQGWFINTRRPKFADRRVRQALGLLFDFEWTNQNIMFGSYQRTASFFENSPLKAEGLPSEAELALLEPLRDRLPEETFGEAYVPPLSDGSGRDRNLLRRASELFREAGCTISGSRLLTPDGRPFTIEFLDDDRSFEPHHNAYINTLALVGIAGTYRVVDAAQSTERLKRFDFDMTVSRFAMPLFPHEGIRNFFSSESAARDGSYNLSGIADPAVDALLDKVVGAQEWDTFVTACKALDRVLRASHFWVPQYYKATHWFAYWTMYSRPEIKPDYDRAVVDTWWYDPEAATRIGMASDR